MIARAFVCIPLPPTSEWRLVRKLTDIPTGYTPITVVDVGVEALPAIGTDAQPLRAVDVPEPVELCHRCPLHRRRP